MGSSRHKAPKGESISFQPIDQQGYGPVVIVSAACGSSSITVRPSGPAPASANTSISSPARSREPAATRLRRSRARGRIGCRRAVASELPGVRIVDRRVPVAALNFAWHRLRWPPIEALAGGEYDIAHSPHPLLLPARSAAQVVTIHDLHFLSHPERTSAEIRRDYPALVRAHARLADRIIVVSRFVAGEVQRVLGIAGRSHFCLSQRRAGLEGAARCRRCGRLPAVRRHDRATQECRRAARRICAAARTPRQCSATRHRGTCRS